MFEFTDDFVDRVSKISAPIPAVLEQLKCSEDHFKQQEIMIEWKQLPVLDDDNDAHSFKWNVTSYLFLQTSHWLATNWFVPVLFCIIMSLHLIVNTI